MAIIGFSASPGEWISMRVSRKREILHVTTPSTSATIFSTPSTASTATASIIVRGCQCSQDLVELEREKVALLRDVCGLLRESADYQKEVIVLKRAKLDIMARQLALEEETRSSKM
ncbi:unnamed protein product [Arctogadus glacialis]